MLFNYNYNKKININSIIGFLVSGILLWFTVKRSGLEWKNLALTTNQLAYFIAAIAAFIFSVWLQSYRAKLLWIDEKRKYGNVDTYSGYMIGNFYNCIIPANLGDGVRAYHFSQKNNVTFSRSLAAILTEKFIDGLGFVLFPIILFTIKPFIPDVVSITILLTGVFGIFLWSLFLLMKRNKKLEKKTWQLICKLGGKTGRYAYKLYYHTSQHILGLVYRGTLTNYILLTVIAFTVNALQFFFLMKAVGIGYPVNSLYTSFLISGGSMVLVFIPSAPGNVGVIHYGTYRLLLFAASVYQYMPNQDNLKAYALFGIYMHFSFLFPELLLGTIFLLKERRWVFKRK